MKKAVAVPPKTELSDAEARQILDRIAEIVRDQLALEEHFLISENFRAAFDSQAHAYDKLCKYLLWFMPELAPPEPPKEAKKRVRRKAKEAS